MLNTKRNEPVLVDQYTDRSGAELVKIANRMADKALGALAIDTLFNMPGRQLRKEATFASDSAADTFLSRIYFEAQRADMPEKTAAAIDQRLGVREALYGLPGNVSFRQKEQVKTAAAETHELLPSCKIASSEELFQAGKDFSEDFSYLSFADRHTFAQNFTKLAADMSVPVPDSVKLYTTTDVELNKNAMDNVLLRKVAQERSGAENDCYVRLYDGLRQTDLTQESVEELAKLAAQLEALDEQTGILDTNRGGCIPDAWHSIFTVKQAEQENVEPKANTMTKADIVSRYGDGILEDIEDLNGNIDRERLKAIMKAVGDARDSHADNDDSDDNNAAGSTQ